MNSWWVDNHGSVLPVKLIGTTFLILWGSVGFISYKFEKAFMKSAIVAHLPALLTFLLIMYQTIILGAYWPNFFGTVTQFYYLPLLNLSHSLTNFFWPANIGVTLVILIALLFMFAAFYVGDYLRKKFIA